MNAKLLGVSTTFQPTITVKSQDSDAISAFQAILADFNRNGHHRYTINEVFVKMEKKGYACSMYDGVVSIYKY